jgi:hypothetical protein
VVLFALVLLTTGAAFTAAGVLNVRGIWRPFTSPFPFIGSGMLFMGVGILLWGLIALTAGLVMGPSGDEAPEPLQWILTAVGCAALLCFAAGVVFGYGHLPRRLRPRWMTDGEGGTVPLDGGVPAALPAWSSAVSGSGLATSRGPVLTPEAVDWLYRGWSMHWWSGFAGSEAAAPLRELGMVGDAGRPAPDVVLAAQPLHGDAVTVCAVAQRRRGGDEGEAAEMIVRAGPRHAVVLWQEEFWPTDQRGMADRRPWRQRVGDLAGPGRRRRVSTAYRVDFVDGADVGTWVAGFVAATGGPGAVWQLYLDGDQAFELATGEAPGEFRDAVGKAVNRASDGRTSGSAEPAVRPIPRRRRGTAGRPG